MAHTHTQLGSACVFAAAERGVAGGSHQGQCSASSEAGRCATACLGWPPPRQSHFPKVALTHGAPSPTVYVTVAVKGIMAWRLTFLLWGRRGWEQQVRVGLDLFLWMGNVLIAPLASLFLTCLSFSPSPSRFTFPFFGSASVSSSTSLSQASPQETRTPPRLPPLTFLSVFPPVWGQACPSVFGTLTVSDG